MQDTARRRGSRRPYTLAEKNEVLATFERGRRRGIPDAEIICECGVSQATIYRWIRETDVKTPKWRGVCLDKLEAAIANLSIEKSRANGLCWRKYSLLLVGFIGQSPPNTSRLGS